ncbi:YqzE family protein [Salipaludibacillus sp. HK11]|uniref:YqzE family protein n=1 Tax=Salipaludibacillus sp. HK11 TaxID=3394320 RepID=UPI0039FCF60C
MKSNDYLKYMTQQIVSYADQPKEIRKANREQKKKLKPDISYRLFGMIPFSIRLFMKNRRHD